MAAGDEVQAMEASPDLRISSELPRRIRRLALAGTPAGTLLRGQLPACIG
ncbi:hypothetical protein I7I48_09855 [Histoplasma ohiense]|nr:hypothetical protein I7I48_09855 [Histoplasma ohiense (nom. inval.)]